MLTYVVFVLAGGSMELPLLGVMAEDWERSLQHVESASAVTGTFIICAVISAVLFAPFAVVLFWDRRIVPAAVLAFAPFIAVFALCWLFRALRISDAWLLNVGTPASLYAGLWLAYLFAPRLSCRLVPAPRS